MEKEDEDYKEMISNFQEDENEEISYEYIQGKMEQKRKEMKKIIKPFENSLSTSYDNLLSQFSNHEKDNFDKDNKSYEAQICENKLTRVLEIDNFIKKGLTFQLENYTKFITTIDYEIENINQDQYLENSLFNNKLIKASDDFDFLSYEILFPEEIHEAIIKTFDFHRINYFTINSDNNKNNDKEFIKTNKEIIKNITFNSIIKNNQNDYFTEENIFTILETMTFEDCICTTNKLVAKVNESLRFPSLKQLIFDNTKFIKDKSIGENNNDYKFMTIPPFLNIQPLPELEVLKIEKAGLINSDFDHIFLNIICNTSLVLSLKILSFAYNFITQIEHDKLEICFQSLEEFNLMHNQISSIIIQSPIFTKLRHLNLAHNLIGKKEDIYISFDTPDNMKKLLITCNQNPFLMNENNIQAYKGSLITLLNKSVLSKNFYSSKEQFFSNEMTYLNFAGLYNRRNNITLIEDIKQIHFENLRELDCSSCGLDSEIAFNLFKICNFLPRVNILSMKGNCIDLDFFKYIKNSPSSLRRHSGLEHLILSNNYIEDGDFHLMERAIKQFKNLKHLDLTNNPFSLNYTYEVTQYKQVMTMSMISGLKAYNAINEESESLDMSFTQMISHFYPSDRMIYIDISSETEDFICSILEKKLLTITIKKKKNLF